MIWDYLARVGLNPAEKLVHCWKLNRSNGGWTPVPKERGVGNSCNNRIISTQRENWEWLFFHRNSALTNVRCVKSRLTLRKYIYFQSEARQSQRCGWIFPSIREMHPNLSLSLSVKKINSNPLNLTLSLHSIREQFDIHGIVYQIFRRPKRSEKGKISLTTPAEHNILIISGIAMKYFITLADGNRLACKILSANHQESRRERNKTMQNMTDNYYYIYLKSQQSKAK